MLFGALLRPSLFAPETPALTLLDGLSVGSNLQFLHALRRPIMEINRKGYFPTAANLAGPVEAAERRQRIDRAAEALKLWGEASASAKILYAPATGVWRACIGPKGVIGSVIGGIFKGKKDAIRAARHFIEEYGKPAAVDNLIQSTDRKLRGSSIKKIEARAITKLRGNVNRTIGLLEEWVNLSTDANPEMDTHQAAQRDRLRGNLTKGIEAVRGHLEELETGGSEPITAAVGALRVCLEDLSLLLDPKGTDRAPASHMNALHDDLLKLPNLSYADDFEPVPYSNEVIAREILKYCKQDIVGYEEAFGERLRENNHLATGRLLDILGSDPKLAGRMAEFKLKRRQAIQESRAGLQLKCERLRKDLDQAMSLDMLKDVTLNNLVSRIEAVDPDSLPIDMGFPGGASEVPQDEIIIADFPSAFAMINSVRHALEDAYQNERQIFEKRLETLSERGAKFAPQIERVRSMIERNDLITSSEYPDLLERGENLPSSKVENLDFHEYFPGFTEEICQAIGDVPVDVEKLR